MPYDLFAGMLMFVLFIILLILFIVAVRTRDFSFKKVIPILILTAIVIAIPVAGHTDWNREYQLKNTFDHFQADDYLDDSIAPEFLEAIKDASRPVQVDVVSSTKVAGVEPNNGYDSVIEFAGNTYLVRQAAYTYPLSWTPYESWTIESIQKQ